MSNEDYDDLDDIISELEDSLGVDHSDYLEDEDEFDSFDLDEGDDGYNIDAYDEFDDGELETVLDGSSSW